MFLSLCWDSFENCIVNFHLRANHSGYAEREPNVKTWNNIHNASMHVMMKWDEAQLREKICPTMSPSDFAHHTPKQIFFYLEAWFESLVINK